MRVLFLTHRLPYAPNRGDRIRAYYTLEALKAAGAQVELVSLTHNAEEASHVPELSRIADKVHAIAVPRLRNWLSGTLRLPTQVPLTHALLDAPGVKPALRRIVADRPPDAVLAYCSGMARFAVEPPLAGLPLIIDLVDVDSLKWRDLSGTSRPPLAWVYRREATYLARFEARAARLAFATTVVNERERDVLASLVPDARIDVVPSGVNVEHWQPIDEPPPSADVVFCGVMNYTPNVDAAVWMARDVWPLVRARRADARLKLVGSEPTARVQALHDPSRGIEVTGHVPDVRPYLWLGAVSAAPLHTARGIQNKVLEAVAAGLPAVVTPVVAEGLPREILPACEVASSAASFADAVVRALARSPAERRRAAAQADLRPLSWSARLAPLVDLLLAAVEKTPPRRSARPDADRRA
ncbi:MAG TPA: TIGR03087 family PEP-CTERM/XrtA system glycosyltransferase [Vicinamibacterales bacterium]|nr:TIGR03087 family PEP-CTERM/XrtA system glycosyltransferase [Vicinamibacterales bacterium]